MNLFALSADIWPLALGLPRLSCRVSHKSARIFEMIESFRGRELDAHYLGYFACFNEQKFYEAHDVLEDLWLPDRHGANGNFYKGLIQLAGAFVHLQKNRLRPAAALFNLAKNNLEKYPRRYEQLDLSAVLLFIQHWLHELATGNFIINPLTPSHLPQLAPLPACGWVFYDGDCRFCTGSVRRFARIFSRIQFVPVPFQNPFAQRKLNLPENFEPAEMVVLTPDGKQSGGANAVAQIARRIWWAWPLFVLAQVPGIHFIFTVIYRRIAARRHCLGGSCEISPPKK